MFKGIVRDTRNYKNVLKTLADRHQKSMAFYLSSARFLKPTVQTSKVESIFVDALPKDTHSFISSVTKSGTLYSTEQVTIDGTLFASGMFVCTGVCGALPEFKEIQKILLMAEDIFFVLKGYESWFIEHLRSYELTVAQGMAHTVITVNDLFDQLPLVAYRVAAKLLLVTKRFIPISEME